MRELETVNQYQEAHDAATHPAVKALMAHLLFEEKEHIAELTELLKRLDPDQSHHFEGGHAAAIGAGELERPKDAPPGGSSPTVGSLLGLPQ